MSEAPARTHAARDDGGLPGPARGAAVACLTGTAALALELTAARLFMPWFGASIHVWSKVIGVALGALALGNLAGGRIAARWPTRRALTTLLLIAGVLAALAPLLARSMAIATVPNDLTLEVALELLGRASLITALGALGLPLFVLGAVYPLLVKGAAAQWSVERSSGVMSALSTFGGLIGTFVPVHYTIPQFGSRVTCYAVGALLAIAAVVAAWPPRRGARALAGWIVVFAIPFCAYALEPPGPWKPAAGPESIVYEADTAYQYARVERDGASTRLCLNEGLDSFHSLTYAGELTTRGAYYDSVSLLAAGAFTRDRPARVLVLGFAAGTIARQLVGMLGPSVDLTIDGVELDPAVAELGSRFFDLPRDPRIRVFTGVDARAVLDRSSATYDVIIVDAYAHQIHIPFQLCSREFFASVRRHLESNGLFVANVSAFSADDAAIQAIAATAKTEFPQLGALAVPHGRNFVLAGSVQRPVSTWLVDAAALPAELVERRAAAMDVGGVFEWIVLPNARVLTDDRSPIENLMEADLARRAALLLSFRDSNP